MKKVILGFLSIIFAGQVIIAQPVSDMAVIPMGITIQSVMRLTITKGGNIEFVFNSAADRTNGLGPAGYQTAGSIVSSQAWQLDLTTDAATFLGEDGATTLILGVVAHTVATAGTNAGTAIAAGLLATPLVIIDGGLVTDDATFTIDWECGTAAATAIPATTAPGRYTVNIILSLGPDV